MATGDTMGYALYVSDNGTTYVTKLSQVSATQGGFAGFALTPPAATPVWPFGHRMMRHVTGKSGTGKRATLYVASASNSKYVSGGTFTIDAGTFSILGMEGERRPASRIR